MKQLLIFGLGYSGSAIAKAASAAGFVVSGTSRAGTEGTVAFENAENAITTATHIVSTAAPLGGADPVLTRYRGAIAAAPKLRWVGYLSTTAVYGNRDGGWVDEDTPPAPTQQRGVVRLTVETDWATYADSRAVDIFRLAGIYGPGRSALDDIRAGRARRLIRPGHQFSRIHRDDIAQAVVAAMLRDQTAGRRIFNLADDAPTESAVVVEEAAALLGVPPPPRVAYADAEPQMSAMARSFWAENRRVASAKTKAALGIAWMYPSYSAGLRAILAEESAQRGA